MLRPRVDKCPTCGVEFYAGERYGPNGIGSGKICPNGHYNGMHAIRALRPKQIEGKIMNLLSVEQPEPTNDSRVIFKYELLVQDYQTVELPRGAQILCLQAQYDIPQLWALVEDGAPKEQRHFRTIGTGHTMDNSVGMLYLSSYQMRGGELVFHVFEICDRRVIV